MTRSADIPLVPLSNNKFSELLDRDDVRKPLGGTPELGDKHDEANLSTQAYTGKCDQFDLSIPEHRQRYAELTAKLLSGAEYMKLWEERIPGSDGKFYIYVTYVQVMTVFSTGNDRFDLNEDN